LDRSALFSTDAEVFASTYRPSVPCENASARSGQFQLRTAGGAYLERSSTYHSSAAMPSLLLARNAPPANHSPPKLRKIDG
jgi:hypothetical protein